MKKLIVSAVSILLSLSALAATTIPVQLLNPTGSSSGQTIVSSGSSTAPAWGGISLSGLAAIAANTVVANATTSSATPTAFVMPSCSTSSSALNYTTNTGIGCNTSINATSLGGTAAASYALLASPSLTGTPTAPTAAGGTNTSQIATTGFVQSDLVAPAFAIGSTTPNGGTFTTLAANNNVSLRYVNASGQALAASTATVITGWTIAFDRTSSFAASTGIFTAPHAGHFEVSGQLLLSSSTAAAGTQFKVDVLVNGVVQNTAFSIAPVASQGFVGVSWNVSVSLSANDQVKIQATQTDASSRSLQSSTAFNWIGINEIP